MSVSGGKRTSPCGGQSSTLWRRRATNAPMPPPSNRTNPTIKISTGIGLSGLLPNRTQRPLQRGPGKSQTGSFDGHDADRRSPQWVERRQGPLTAGMGGKRTEGHCLSIQVNADQPSAPAAIDQNSSFHDGRTTASAAAASPMTKHSCHIGHLTFGSSLMPGG